MSITHGLWMTLLDLAHVVTAEGEGAEVHEGPGRGVEAQTQRQRGPQPEKGQCSDGANILFSCTCPTYCLRNRYQPLCMLRSNYYC